MCEIGTAPIDLQINSISSLSKLRIAMIPFLAKKLRVNSLYASLIMLF